MKTYQFNVYRKLTKTVLWIVAWVSISFAAQVLADQTPNIARHRFDSWERASDRELDQLRGGFVLPNGMNIDFSIERISSLNGAVVSHLSFQLPDNHSLFQNGALNQPLNVADSGLSSIIQNNADNQVIRTVTDINIAVSNLKNISLNNRDMDFNNLILSNAH